MKRSRIIALVAAVLFAAAILGSTALLILRQHRAERVSGAHLIGRPAADFRLARLDGQPGGIALSDLRGRPVLIEFFATWCPPCERIGSAVAEFAARHESRGLATIGVSFDTAETVAAIPAYLAKHGVRFPVVGEGKGHAGAVMQAYGVESIPHLILIDAAGRIATSDLAGASPDETTRNLQLAVLPHLRSNGQ